MYLAIAVISFKYLYAIIGETLLLYLGHKCNKLMPEKVSPHKKRLFLTETFCQLHLTMHASAVIISQQNN